MNRTEWVVLTLAAAVQLPPPYTMNDEFHGHKKRHHGEPTCILTPRQRSERRNRRKRSR